MSDNFVFVADLSDFGPGKRHLVKFKGVRNIAVYNVKGTFYAMDNACYHHGGPLLNGDIETLGGHPCVKCPWHSYEISLATGEGLYWGIKVNPGGGKPERALQSKGKKQRVHDVVVKGSEVFVEVDVSGTWESDGYAEMAIANREQAQASSGSTGGAGLHSGLRSGQFLNRNSSVPFGNNNSSSNNSSTLGGRTSSGVTVKVTKIISVSASGNTKMFVWEKAGSSAFMSRTEPGQYATVTLPEGFDGGEGGNANNSKPTILSAGGGGGGREDADDIPPPVSAGGGGGDTRTWTITSVRGDHGGWFTTTVKRQSTTNGGRGGSAWLHDKGLHVPLPLKEISGHFHVGAARERINGKKGYLLMISAGVGITPMYASLNKYLNDPFTTTSGPPLHVLHLHAEKQLEEVPFLGALALWHSSFGGNNRAESPVSFQFKLAVTSKNSGTSSTGTLDPHAFAATLPPSYQQGSSHNNSTEPRISQALGQLQTWKDSTEHKHAKAGGGNLHAANPHADAIPNVTFGSRLTVQDHLLPACEHFGDAVKRGGGGGNLQTPPLPATAGGGESTSGAQQQEVAVESRDFMVMVCGPQGFMDSITEQLVAQCGVVRNNILTEAFDF